MEKIYKFAVDSMERIDTSAYDEDEFLIARMNFLSTRPNAHGFNISEEVLRQSAPSVLGKWVVADMTAFVDAGTHTDKEQIVGRVPENQEVQFVTLDDGYLMASVETVISKIYAKDFCAIFDQVENSRSVSVEMKVSSDPDDEKKVESFKIVGVTALGKKFKPSSPGANIEIMRFSAEDADHFFSKVHNNSLTALKKFVDERKVSMATTYKIDKSKESISDKPWGEVDKAAMRDKIMGASNRATLVKSVYALVESGWEEAPSEHLKYPIMELKGDTFVYNRNALASALGYAKKENETSVVNKIEKIYKSLDLDGKEGTAKMSNEVHNFAAVEIGDLWSMIFNEIRKRDDWRYGIAGVYEESNQKFAVLKDRDGKLYRLDFSLAEDNGLEIADTLTEVKQEFIDSDNVIKFAEPEACEKYKEFECEKEREDCEMSADEMKVEMERLQCEVDKRDNIIMEKDAELEELRQFKAGVEKEKLTMSVEAIMSEVKDCLDAETCAQFREEGLKCSADEIDAWSNKVKAYCFEHGKVITQKGKNEVFSFAAPIDVLNSKKSGSAWDYFKK